MGPSANVILQRIRQTTRPYHEAVERRVDLLRPGLTIDAYRSLLGRFHGFYRPLERALLTFDHWQPLGLDMRERGKARFLERDLRHLAKAGNAPQPECEDLPKILTFPQALGCAYVLEGSTLGGQVVLRHLRQAFGIDADSGAAFFNSYGPQRVGPMWRAFCDALERAVPEGDEADEVVDAARDTFVKIDQWFAAGEMVGSGREVAP
jgi:heme oxygenase